MPLVDSAFEAWLPNNGVQSVRTYMNSLGYIETEFLGGRALRNAVPLRTEELLTNIQNRTDLSEERKSDLSSALVKYDTYKQQRQGPSGRTT